MAYDDAGAADKEPHLVSGSDWRFQNPGKADDDARSAAFGQRVEFDYAGLNPHAAYRVKLRFFSDGQREERVKAADVVLLSSIVLDAGQVVDREADVPATAYTSGTLSVAIENVRGPNAVVSGIELLSTDPSLLQEIALPEARLPELTPRPVTPRLWARREMEVLFRGAARVSTVTSARAVGRRLPFPANGPCRVSRSSRERPPRTFAASSWRRNPPDSASSSVFRRFTVSVGRGSTAWRSGGMRAVSSPSSSTSPGRSGRASTRWR